ncbi:MAG: alkaline phosphatase family protein [Candidatus Thermoplasmatota archaeon]|jgi:predicted AlkP superfamily phosphohydrolase/phosphomutase|nr:alkaline phosphatase family protein [Candidatus Thermoplasmatota archaeon]
MKVMVVGLDCAAPVIMFDKLRDYLPNITKLTQEGIYGKLRSCDPPITIPAWMVMATGRSPGELGLYGFRSRVGNSYNQIKIPTSRDIKFDTVWEILGRRNKRSIIVAVPPTYPPKPIPGIMVSDFLTPDKEKEFTYPPGFKNEIMRDFPDYQFDVKFRKPEKEKIITEIHQMSDTRFKLVEKILKEKQWDFFFMVEIGIDRIHHAFWRYIDKDHHLYEDNPEMKDKFIAYFKMVDSHIGKIVDSMDDETVLLIVSDHGAKGMSGAFAINQWLIREGYLVTQDEHVKQGASLDDLKVDWSRTKAWAWGGYYARIFLNVKGRESEGVIDPKDVKKELETLKQKLKEIKGPNGEHWNTIVFEPEEKYEIVNGDRSDLFVYLDDLNWRAAGTLGYESDYMFENDTGPDDAVHDYDGIYIMFRKNRKIGKNIDSSIFRIAPTILELYNVRKKYGIKGEPMEGIDYVR